MPVAQRLQAVRHLRPHGLGVAEGCRAMGVARSGFYARSRGLAGDTALVARVAALCDGFPAYGCRRVAAQLRADGLPVDRERIARPMPLHGLQPRRRHRRATTTGSAHDGPISPNLAPDVVPDGPDRLWVADITCIALAQGFAYPAVILDAWSRRVVGYALGRMLGARLTVAALRSAVDARRPARGCVHHSDRGCQYAAERYRAVLAEHGITGSMGRRGNPHDNGKAESFVKALEAEAVYDADYQNFEEAAAHLPRFIEEVHNAERLHSALGYRSPMRFEERHARRMVKAEA